MSYVFFNGNLIFWEKKKHEIIKKTSIKIGKTNVFRSTSKLVSSE